LGCIIIGLRGSNHYCFEGGQILSGFVQRQNLNGTPGLVCNVIGFGGVKMLTLPGWGTPLWPLLKDKPAQHPLVTQKSVTSPSLLLLRNHKICVNSPPKRCATVCFSIKIVWVWTMLFIVVLWLILYFYNCELYIIPGDPNKRPKQKGTHLHLLSPVTRSKIHIFERFKNQKNRPSILWSCKWVPFFWVTGTSYMYCFMLGETFDLFRFLRLHWIRKTNNKGIIVIVVDFLVINDFRSCWEQLRFEDDSGLPLW